MVDWSASYQLGFSSTLVYFSYCKALLNSCCDLHHQARKGNQQHEQSPTKAGKNSFTQRCHQHTCWALGGSPSVYCWFPRTSRSYSAWVIQPMMSRQAAWPSSLGAGLVLWWCRVQFLHPSRSLRAKLLGCTVSMVIWSASCQLGFSSTLDY